MLHPIHTFIHRIGRLVLLDRAADPAANGEFQRNATHVKVYSGGAVRNLSDVGAAPSHTHASHTGIGTGDHHAQLHAAAHLSAGGDAIKLDDLAAPDDNTDLNASTTLHGLLLKLGGGTTNFLRADGTWSAPGGGGTDKSARVYHSLSQSIANATEVVVAFDSERWDTDTIHDNVTNNSRLTATTAGKYKIDCLLAFGANATGLRRAYIRLNGATNIGEDQATAMADGTEPTHLAISMHYNLAATDYIEVVVFQNSGAARNLNASGNKHPEFMMMKVLG